MMIRAPAIQDALRVGPLEHCPRVLECAAAGVDESRAEADVQEVVRVGVALERVFDLKSLHEGFVPGSQPDEAGHGSDAMKTHRQQVPSLQGDLESLAAALHRRPRTLVDEDLVGKVCARRPGLEPLPLAFGESQSAAQVV